MLEPRCWLQLRLMGGCKIEKGGENLGLESNKVRALLVYLVMNPQTHQRDKLIGLFWADFPEENARRNLRHTLWNLRQRLNRPGGPPILIVDSQSVKISPDIDIWVDAAAFQDVIHQNMGGNKESDLSILDTGMELYQGDFLEGFYVRDTPVFSEWALVERERLRTLALDAIQRLTLGYASRGENKNALTYARRWLSISPWQEDAHRHVMRLLADMGQRESALQQYEICRQVLAAELGVAPTQETTLLYEQIKVPDEDQNAVFHTQIPPLPPTPFVGRDHEIARLSELLDDPDCRLVTLTGPGGIGKTRLALQIASLKNAASGLMAAFVPLENLNTPQDIIPAIVNALGFTLFGPRKPREQLLNILREKQILLVMDNFEHLLEEVLLIRDILQTAPSIKILVTSRERLNLKEEWIFPLEGLLDSDGLQLFTGTARRFNLGFTSDGEEAHLAKICQLVFGVPLAIEMAAAWVRVLSCKEIVTELESHPITEFLSTQMRDVPNRHHSIHAVFDHSWELLSTGEKQRLMHLMVFRGGFEREAAEVVAGASLADLSVLVDKSLLRRNLKGRYEFHGLIREFASEKFLATGDPGVIKSSHAQYYCQLLKDHEDSIGELLHQMGIEIGNVRAAWEWAISQQAWNLIEQLHNKLYVFFEVRSSFQEGRDFFQEAIRSITGGIDPLELQGNGYGLLPWKLLAVWSALTCRLGQIDVASETFSRCIEIFRCYDAQKELAFSLFYLGDTTRLSGNLNQAQSYLHESLKLYKILKKGDDIAFVLNVLGLVSAMQGEYKKARNLLEQSRETFLQIGHPWGLAIVNINLGSLLKRFQDYQTATFLLTESLSLCQELGHRWAAAVCLNHLGDISYKQGNLEEAKSYYQKSLTLHQEIGNPDGTYDVIIHLADILQSQDQPVRALGLLLKFSSESIQDEKINAQVQEKISTLGQKLSSAEYQNARRISQSKTLTEILGFVA